MFQSIIDKSKVRRPSPALNPKKSKPKAPDFGLFTEVLRLTLFILSRDIRKTTDLPRHAVTLPNVSVKVTHPGASVLTDRATERLFPRVHPKAHLYYMFTC